MAPRSSFVLKDSPAEVLAATDVKPKGRTYTDSYSSKPGGIKIKDVVLGMKLASIAVTDDKPDTLNKVSKQNPWHEEALTWITGSKEEAHSPLTDILDEHFDLKLDTHIDISGFRGGGAIDTQGYIAHNDEIIVLSYRCTTSILDWITNLSTTTSEWEPEIDVELGHSGICSCLMGYNFFGGKNALSKPRVHTGFYNNFISSMSLLKKYIEPLLAEGQPPRKLYVVGHSLGAGIAQLAASYFLLNFEWELLPQKLACVTAGAPRSCLKSFQEIVNTRLKQMKELDKVSFCRIVLNEDMVTKVPPQLFGFVHLDDLVYITKEGEVLIRPDYWGSVNNEKEYAKEVKEELTKVPSSDAEEEEQSDTEGDASDAHKNAYEKKLKLVPRSLRDHMPDFYLKPLVRLFEEEHEKMVQSMLSEEE